MVRGVKMRINVYYKLEFATVTTTTTTTATAFDRYDVVVCAFVCSSDHLSENLQNRTVHMRGSGVGDIDEEWIWGGGGGQRITILYSSFFSLLNPDFYV